MPKRESKGFSEYRNEDIFRSIINYASDAIIPIDISGKIVFWNKAAEKIFGYSSEEIVGKPVTKIMPSHFGKHGSLHAEEAIISREGFVGKTFETVGVRKDGSTFPLEFSYSVWTTEEGVFLTLIARDITERKKMEEMLRSSEERYRSLFENAKDIIVLLDLKGKIVNVNKACENYGVKRKEIIGKNALDFVSQDYRSTVFEEIKKLSKGKLVSGEVEIKTPKGIAFAEYSGNPIKIDKHIVGIQIIVRDITQRKRDEERIRQSEKMFRELFETSLDGIVMVDMHGKIVDCNQAYLNMLGYSKNELKRMTFHQITPEKWHKIEERIIKEQVIRKGYSSEYEKEYIRKDGKIFPVALKAWLIKDGNGKPKGMWAVVRDITEQKLREKKLKRYTHSLEGLVEKKSKELKETQLKLLQSERLAAIGELAGMVGHDLRNPLMGIAGAVYYLKTKAKSKLDNTEKKMLKIIEENIAYSNKIINDLQDYSRELILELNEIDVKTLLKGSLSSIRIPQSVEIIDETCKRHIIKVDVNKMKRAFVNILQNAVDAMPNGGKIIIKSRKAKDTLVISFKDTGIGIPKEILKKIGKPLFTTKAKGMGFGLAICRRIIEAHEGKLSIKSTVGNGTTVKISLPLTSKMKGKQTILVGFPKSVAAYAKT